jgi:hypothetical protein
VDNPLTGEQLTKDIARLSATPAAVTQRLAKMFDDYLAGR